MAYEHERYCDGDHAPRQRCNDRRAPSAAADVIGPEIEPTPEPAIAVTSEPVEVEVAMRDPVAATVRAASMPGASRYVTLEASRVASATEREYDDAEMSPYGSADEERRPTVRLLVVIVLIALAVWWFLLRRSGADEDAGGD